MKSDSRNSSKVLGALVLSWMAFGYADAADKNSAGPRDELQSWINKSVVSIRSVDPLDDDYKDLNFLIDVIGNARVVQLGEASHAVGNGFAAKARLVKFLHERMGFDVLVWEEGIYGMRLMQADLRGSEDVRSVAQRSLRTGWANSKEISPLFEYAKVSLLSTRPLELAGYDSRFTDQAYESFASNLRSFVGALPDVNGRSRMQNLVESALAAYDRICCTKDVQPGQRNDLDSLHRAADALLKGLDADRRMFEQVHGAWETSFMERSIESMRSDGTGKFYLAQATPSSPDAGTYFSRFWHQRDEQGARNLRWLIEKGYPGRKLIFWAHNVHVMDAYCGPMFKDVSLIPRPDDMKPVGVYMADWFGDQIYTIGLAHFDGQEGLTGSVNTTPIPPASPGSLEARLHALGRPFLFLNLRSADGNPSHPLHQPQSLRVFIPTSYTVSDITRIFDGILYIDRATPVTPARAVEQPSQ